MYQYQEIDQKIVNERVEQFRDQVERRLDGRLSEDDFRPLRLMNGLYHQRHAYMLRVAIPYGLLATQQLRALAEIAREYDRGYGHFTTRQNIQFNWPELQDVPDILEKLSGVEMHAIQTSGNCVRNISSDHLAGVAADEIEDPRPYCEILRQWSTFHPEFTFLPRKFKIAFTGARHDRAAIAAHDIGFRVVEGPKSRIGFEVLVGGGLGRTPIVGKVVRPFLDPQDLLTYTEAILRVYNLNGNRKNKYRARIKILLKTLGLEEFTRQVEKEWEAIRGTNRLDNQELDRVRLHFRQPEYERIQENFSLDELRLQSPPFGRWLDHNVLPHRQEGYSIVVVSLKSTSRPPGDMTADQMDAVADLADRMSFGEIRTTHHQNLVLADVRIDSLFEVWKELEKWELATPNIGTLTDMICCPGLDFCSLANAGSIGVAKEVTDRFADLDHLYDLGPLELKLSGCINACGHHHVGHIGILGIDKKGEEFYQIMLGGAATDNMTLGKWLGPAIAKDKVVDALERIVETYVEQRHREETFLNAYCRLGPKPFKEAVYAYH